MVGSSAEQRPAWRDHGGGATPAPVRRLPGLQSPRRQLLAIRRPRGPVRQRVPGDQATAWTTEAARRRRIARLASVLVPQAGWVDVDPTNDQFVDDRYVVLAHGRDYDDVPALKGVILSDASHSRMRVRVDVTRV